MHNISVGVHVQGISLHYIDRTLSNNLGNVSCLPLYLKLIAKTNIRTSPQHLMYLPIWQWYFLGLCWLFSVHFSNLVCWSFLRVESVLLCYQHRKISRGISHCQIGYLWLLICTCHCFFIYLYLVSFISRMTWGLPHPSNKTLSPSLDYTSDTRKFRKSCKS